MEMYGREAIVKEVQGQRRNLNVEGLGALDMRTTRPDGKHWDLSCRERRKLARQMIRELEPQWIIGSPPCTMFSAWNEKMNYRKVATEKVEQLKHDGRRHLQFVIGFYRRQISLGRHFLHEHPASAGSWSDPNIQALAKLPSVKIAEIDQCAYGLVTPSEIDGSPMPAKKPTRCLPSAECMVSQLPKECPGDHVHQHLVGGRCAAAAFYPLPSVRAILRGIRHRHGRKKKGQRGGGGVHRHDQRVEFQQQHLPT